MARTLLYLHHLLKIIKFVCDYISNEALKIILIFDKKVVEMISNIIDALSKIGDLLTGIAAILAVYYGKKNLMIIGRLRDQTQPQLP